VPTYTNEVPLQFRKTVAAFITSVIRAVGLDQAIAFSVSARLWQIMAATGTVILMTHFFSRELQGYYYTIVSLLAIQGFLDLGLSGIIVLLASHEWAHLANEDGRITGPIKSKGRLAEIHRFGCWWYSCCATAFLLLVTPIGYYLMSDGSATGRSYHSAWMLPWFACVALNSVSMRFAPTIAILEGCNQVVAVNRMRLSQSITGSLFVWISMASGLGLWTLVVSNLVRLIWELLIIYREYGPFLNELAATPHDGHLDWKSEIWPLQWRLAIQSICSYFATWFIVPVTFRFHGKVAAGQIGLTWQLLTTVQAASLAWLQTRLPHFGGLLASSKHQQLEMEMVRASVLSMVVFVGSMAAFALALVGAEFAGLNLADRFVSPITILLFAIGLVGWTLAIAEQSYVRLFKTDPFLLISVLASCLMALAIWHFGSTSGPHGLSIAYCGVSWLYAVPVSTWILFRHRREHPNP